MKKLLFIFSMILIIGCGYETPRFTEPFIVTEIEYYTDSTCIYLGETQDGWLGSDGFFSSIHPRIVAKCNLYNIGDTIKLNK